MFVQFPKELKSCPILFNMNKQTNHYLDEQPEENHKDKIERIFAGSVTVRLSC